MSRISQLRALAAGLVLALGGSPLAAQFPSEVAVGTRVRVVVPDSLRQSWAPRTQWLRGEVSALTADTLYLRMHGTAGAVPIRRATIKRIDRSLGVPAPAESAVRGAVGGAIWFGLYWALVHQVGDRDHTWAAFGDAFGEGAAIGASVGFVLGGLFPSERWRRLRLR